MKKENSKVAFGILAASVSVSLILFTIMQGFARNYQDNINSCETEIILKLVSQGADLDLIHAIDIKNELSVLTREQSRLLGAASVGDFGQKYRASAQKRANSFTVGIQKCFEEITPLSRKCRIFSILANVALSLALVLSIFSVEYGLRIHGLYKS